MSIVELPSQTASDRCEQPDQTAAIRGARLSELETPVKPDLNSAQAQLVDFMPIIQFRRRLWC